MTRVRTLLEALALTGFIIALVSLFLPENVPERSVPRERPAQHAGRPTERAEPTPSGSALGGVWLVGEVLQDERPVAAQVKLFGPVNAELESEEAGHFRFDLGPTLKWLADREADESIVTYGPKDSTAVTVCAAQGTNIACASPRIRLAGKPPLVRLELKPGGFIAGTVLDERDRPRAGARVGVSGQDHLKATSSAAGRFVLAVPPGRYTAEASAPHTLMRDGVPAVVEAGKTTEVQLRLWPAVSLAGVVVDGTGTPIRWKEVWSEAVLGSTARATQPTLGHFEIDGLLPGAHRIRVQADGFAIREVDVTAPATDLRVVLEAGLTVTVRVLDESGNALSDAEVGLMSEGGPLHLPGYTTDEDGECHIEGVPRRRYLAAAAEGLRNDKSMTNGGAVSEKVSVSERNTRITLRFPKGEVIQGTVVDSRGRSVPGARVRALPDGVGTVQRLAAMIQRGGALADDAGAFTLRHLRGGRYRVWAEHTDYSNGTGSSVLATAGDSGVRLTLSEKGLIRGRLLHADGSPSLEFRLNDQSIRASDGRFTFPVPGGPTVTLFFNETGYAQEVRSVKAGREREVVLDDVVLTPARRIEGEVVDASTGLPVANASICLADKELPAKEHSVAGGPCGPTVRSDASGRFELSNGGSASASLLVRHKRYLAKAFAISPQVDRHRLPMVAGLAVSGRVVVEAGRISPTEARVMLMRDKEWLTSPIAPDGTFEVVGARQGTWRIAVRARSSGAFVDLLPSTVEVPAGGLSGLVLTERVGGTELAVRGAGNWVQDRVHVHLLEGSVPLPRDYRSARELGEGAREGEASLDGVVFRGVAPGVYTLLVAEGDGHSMELSLYSLPIVVRGLPRETVDASPPPTVTILRIPPEP